MLNMFKKLNKAEEKYLQNLQILLKAIISNYGKCNLFITHRDNLENQISIDDLLIEIFDHFKKDSAQIHESNLNCIFGILPLGMKSNHTEYTSMDQKLMMECCKKIADNGKAFFIVSNSFFSRKNFIEKLETEGFYINSILGLPTPFYANNATEVQLIIISKTQIYPIQIDSIDEINENTIKKVIKDNIYSHSLNNLSEFTNITNYIYKKYIDEVMEEYKKDYEIGIFGNLFDIVSLKDSSQIEENGIYIHRVVGNKIRIYNPKELEEKNAKSNILQLIIKDQTKIDIKYFLYYLKTKLAYLLIQSAQKGGVIPSINTSNLSKCSLVYIKEIENQQTVVKALDKLEAIKSNSDKFEQKIQMDLKFAIENNDNIEKLYKSILELTEEEKILELISNWEDTHVEFKEVLKDRNLKQPIQDKICQTICSFANTEGGVILVGVDDNRKLVGCLKNFKDEDEVNKEMFNIFKQRLGREYEDKFSYKIRYVNNIPILKIDVYKSSNPMYFHGEFYRRKLGANDKLNAKDCYDHIIRNYPAIT